LKFEKRETLRNFLSSTPVIDSTHTFDAHREMRIAEK